MRTRNIILGVVGVVVAGLIMDIVVGNLFVSHENPPR